MDRLYNENDIKNIADAIRTKAHIKSAEEKFKVSQMSQVILSIPEPPVKLFETVEDMQADEEAVNGDLAVVYDNTTFDGFYKYDGTQEKYVLIGQNGTITPPEYNTALTTANLILGGDINE